MNTNTNGFGGAKAALMLDDKLVVYLRDNKPGLWLANMWDFAGGGREGTETPFECLAREVEEEFGMGMEEGRVVWHKEYPGMRDPSQKSHFFVVLLSQKDIDDIVFGDEGQEWKLMSASDFLKEANAIPALKARLKDYLDSIKV